VKTGRPAPQSVPSPPSFPVSDTCMICTRLRNAVINAGFEPVTVPISTSPFTRLMLCEDGSMLQYRPFGPLHRAIWTVMKPSRISLRRRLTTSDARKPWLKGCQQHEVILNAALPRCGQQSMQLTKWAAGFRGLGKTKGENSGPNSPAERGYASQVDLGTGRRNHRVQATSTGILEDCRLYRRYFEYPLKNLLNISFSRNA